MERIGVFVCHCGTNIAGTVDVAKVAEELGISRSYVSRIEKKVLGMLKEEIQD